MGSDFRQLASVPPEYCRIDIGQSSGFTACTCAHVAAAYAETAVSVSPMMRQIADSQHMHTYVQSQDPMATKWIHHDGCITIDRPLCLTASFACGQNLKLAW